MKKQEEKRSWKAKGPILFALVMAIWFFFPLQSFDETAWLRCPPKPQISNQLFRNNRARVMANIELESNSAILLKGRESMDALDQGISFKQDSNFYYISGYAEPDAQLILTQNRTALVLPPKSIRNIAFEGNYTNFEELQKLLGLEKVIYVDQIPQLLRDWSISKVIQSIAPFPEISTGLNPDSFLFPVTNSLNSTDELLNAIIRARGHKSKEEIELIRYTTNLASYFHLQMMREASVYSSEYSLLAEFMKKSLSCGCRLQSYSPIFGFKEHGSILHFQQMNQIQGANSFYSNGLLLIDASPQYIYASDVTRTFPITRFTPEMKTIYQIVLDANMAAMKHVKAGQKWSNLTKTASFTILSGLISGGFLYGTVEHLYEKGIHSLFMPHGLGHPVGLDVHDVSRSPYELFEDDIITIEPGIYFNPVLFEDARKKEEISACLNWSLIEKYLKIKFGGVRIEDVVLVKTDSFEMLSYRAPKTIEEIERILARKSNFWNLFY